MKTTVINFVTDMGIEYDLEGDRLVHMMEHVKKNSAKFGSAEKWLPILEKEMLSSRSVAERAVHYWYTKSAQVRFLKKYIKGEIKTSDEPGVSS